VQGERGSAIEEAPGLVAVGAVVRLSNLDSELTGFRCRYVERTGLLIDELMIRQKKRPLGFWVLLGSELQAQKKVVRGGQEIAAQNHGCPGT
jgi:hypothetical protein